MKYLITYLIFTFYSIVQINAQPVSKYLQANANYLKAMDYLRTRDFANAIDYFREAVAIDKENYILLRDYSFAYYLNKEYGKAAIIIDKAMEQSNADENVYDIGCKIYSAKNDLKSAKKTINAGLEKYPNSVKLICQKADLLYTFLEDKEPFILWQKAIDLDANYALPYYSLAKFRDTSSEYLIQTIFNAEKYILLEPFTNNAKEMKMLIYKNYTKLAHQVYEVPTIQAKNISNKKEEPTIEKKYLKIFKNNKYILLGGLNVNNLTQLRARCVEDWSAALQQIELPIIMSYHKRLIHEQLFEVYNQWLFGSFENDNIYQQWANANANSLQLLITFLKDNRIKL